MTSLNEATDWPTTASQTDFNGRRGQRRRQLRQQAPDQGGQKPKINVGGRERAVSVAAGAIAAVTGLSRGTLPGLLIAGVGAALAYRGVTGHCAAYERMGVDTANDREGSEEDEIAQHGVQSKQAFIINRPASELYRFWRNLENLPRIMTHLESVRATDDTRSHWVARANGLGGKRFEWDAEIIQDVPDERISWRSLPGADVENSGEVRFAPALGDRGTDVHITMSYVPPAGRIGHWVASLLGQNPKRVVREELRNFKRLMETGQIPTIIGQPHGTCTGQGERYTESEWKPLFT